jgi:hypothetical protein
VFARVCAQLEAAVSALLAVPPGQLDADVARACLQPAPAP